MRAKLCLIAALLLSAPLAAQDRPNKEGKEGDKPRPEAPGEKAQGRGPCEHGQKEFGLSHKHEGKCGKECEALKKRVMEKYASGCSECGARKEGGEKPVVKRPAEGGPCDHVAKVMASHKHEGKCSKECEGFKRQVAEKFASGCSECAARKEAPRKEAGPCRHATDQVKVAHRHDGKCSEECKPQIEKIVREYDGCLECKSAGGVRKEGGESKEPGVRKESDFRKEGGEIRKEGEVRKDGEVRKEGDYRKEGGERGAPPVKEVGERGAPPVKEVGERGTPPVKVGGERGAPPVKGNNGLGNGEDPAPKGNPPVNDGAGSKPGNPGNRGGPKN